MALLAVALVAPSAMAASNPPSSVTATASASLALGSQRSATARCPKNAPQVTGGGWAAPGFNPNGTDNLADDTGSRTMQLQSQSTSRRAWTAGVGTFTDPSTPGTLDTWAVCEPKFSVKLVKGPSDSTTIPVGQSATLDMNCRRGSHVLSGGYSGSPPGNLANPNEATGLIVVESRRIATRTWEIRAVNPAGASGPATLATNAVCAKNAKTGVREVQSVVAIPDNGRVEATVTCSGRRALSAGFLISPTSPSPAVGITEMVPVGNYRWNVGLYEYPFTALPPGSTLTAFSYCRGGKSKAPRPQGPSVTPPTPPPPPVL